MSRDPESVVFEVDYWRLALEDIMQLNDAMPEIAHELADASVGMVYVAMATGSLDGTERTRAAIDRAMQAVAAAQPAVLRLARLAGGRVEAIRRELEGETEGEQ